MHGTIANLALTSAQVVASAARCLKSDGGFCAFSPCIEQVHKTCAALSQSDFYNVRVMECLLRRYEVRTAELVQDIFAASKPSSGNEHLYSLLQNARL